MLGATPAPARGTTTDAGLWFAFLPGYSLDTGEAEIASRGFFDSGDRPPLALWVAAVTRARAVGSQELEIAILCYAPADVAGRVRAGFEACPNGALRSLESLSRVLSEQLEVLL